MKDFQKFVICEHSSQKVGSLKELKLITKLHVRFTQCSPMVVVLSPLVVLAAAAAVTGDATVVVVVVVTVVVAVIIRILNKNKHRISHTCHILITFSNIIFLNPETTQ